MTVTELLAPPLSLREADVLEKESFLDEENPWPGLASYHEADSLYFHGREAFTENLAHLIQRARLCVLFGESGHGKTSLLRAGLFPLLREMGFLPVYIRLLFTPGSPALPAQIREAIAREAAAREVETPSFHPGDSLWELFHRQQADFWSRSSRRLIPVLIFDQFEETFTLGRDHPGRGILLTELADLIEGRPPQAVHARLETDPEAALQFSFNRHDYRVLFSLREDYLPDLEDLLPAIPSLAHNRCRLRPMTGEEALRVVTLHKELVAPDVAESIVRFVAAEDPRGAGAEGPLARLSVAPPLLSLICRELNNLRQERGLDRITADLLEGHPREILSRFYEESFAGLDAQVRIFVEESLLTALGFRNTVAWEDAVLVPGVTEGALDLLIKRRLLRRESQGEERARVELTHDVLTAVVQASRKERRHREALAAAAAKEREIRLRLRRTRRWVLTFAILALAAAVLAGASFWEWRQARAALSGADFARGSLLLEHDRSADALAYFAAAVRHDSGSPARYALLSLLLNRNWLLPESVFHHSGLVAGDLSSDGHFAITASRDGTARIWRLDAAGNRPLYILNHPCQEIVSARFSQDGLRVITACKDGRACIWDRRSGQAGPVLFHGSELTGAEFSPDGTRVVTASKGGTARLWDAKTGAPGGVLQHKDKEEVRAATFSPDGRLVATASTDKTVRLWWAVSGEPATVPLKHDDSVVSVAFSADGQLVVTASDDKTVRLWSTANGKSFGPPLPHGRGVNDAQISPDGLLLATASTDKAARLWSISLNGKKGLITPVGEPLRHAGRVRSARFSADSRLLVTASDDGTARLWDTQTGRPASEPMRHASCVYSARFVGGGHVLTTSEDGTVRIWDAAPRQTVPVVLKQDKVRSAALSPDGRFAVTAAPHPEVQPQNSVVDMAQLWDTVTGDPVSGPNRLHRDGTIQVTSFSRDGRYVLTAAEDGIAGLWDRAARRVVAVRAGGPVSAAEISPDNRFLATGTRDGTLRLWNAWDGTPIGAEMHHQGDFPDPEIISIHFSRNGNYLVSASMDRTAQLWQVPSGTPVGDSLRHEGSLISAVFSPRDDRILTLSTDWEARLWTVDFRHNRVTREFTLHHERMPHTAELSPDGRRVITVADSLVRIWDADTGSAVLLFDHGSELISAGFSPEGKRVVSASDHKGVPGDHTVRLWDPATGLPASVPLRHGGALRTVQFSQDGQRLLTVADDGKVRIWDVPTGDDWHIDLLADLAEAVAGFRVEGDALTPIFDAPDRLRDLRQAVEGARLGGSDNRALLRWFLLPPGRRPISPLAGK